MLWKQLKRVEGLRVAPKSDNSGLTRDLFVLLNRKLEVGSPHLVQPCQEITSFSSTVVLTASKYFKAGHQVCITSKRGRNRERASVDWV